MLKKLKFKSRKLCLIASFFVLIIALSGCSSAGKPIGNLDTDTVYLSAGDQKVTKGDLWNELRWSANSVLTNKITEVVMKDYVEKVSLILDKSYAEFTDDDKKLFADDFEIEDYNKLKESYEDRLEDFVIEDIYNFNYNSGNSYEKIEDVDVYEGKKLIIQYCDEIYTNYNINTINSQPLQNFVTEAVDKRENYLTIAKELKSIYYESLAKELLAYSVLEEDIKEAYDNRDTDNEDDLGYFTKSEYTDKFKSDFANQSNLNLILIHFSTEQEFNSTLRSFGLKVYEKNLVYIPLLVDDEGKPTETFTEYCTRYDDMSTSDLRDIHQSLNTLAIAQIYIQMYNYLYGGYRDYLYDDSYANYFDNVEDLIKITADIRDKSQLLAGNEEAEVEKIRDALANEKDSYDVNSIYTREEIDKISTSFSTYLYETLCLPFKAEIDDDSLCYSTSTQSYNSSYWIAFKLGQDEDQYADIYNKNTVDDDLYDSIAKNEELKKAIEELLKQDKMTESKINEAVKERTDEVEIKIYDEALEISYATSNSDYSKTYGKAPNKNVIATLKYNKKTWNLNIIEDTTDENALNDGVYNILERQSGITTAIDILSKKVIKQTKAYKDTEKDIADYKTAIEYTLAAFSNDYYSSSGYSSSIGKYNFMMLYFHSVDINNIINDTYRVNGAAAKLLTNYNSNQLLEFFKSYSDNIYNNYFSISGKRLVVYRDADDDSEKDDVSDWQENQKTLAQKLIRQIYNEVASTTGAHADALSSIVTEINESARAKFENNPIAPENKWAEYRKAGLNVEMEDITADNSTTSLDFSLKARLLEIFKSASYSINNTTPTEYMEDLQDSNTEILETKDGYNLLLITSADFQTSAEFKEDDDKLEVFKDISIYYNEEYHQIGSVYNTGKLLTIEQIRLYTLEYVTSSTSNLSPTSISSALSSFLSPVITRYTGNETQRDIVIYLIETKAGKLNFGDNENRYQKTLDINHSSADDYISIYFDQDPTNTLTTYENWWTDLQEIVADILLTEGENA
ncbi:MAG: hypothetical protein NC310_01050 [Roseburia sp.]|nr:hypothetical protein [Anaeroplasma bactoclasticum]MCM1195641.1 hypothetical protein [Roseburia sp.]MCM1556614.1 hypothetical protein [Anaeroplasma bactoclasticum]